MEALTAVAVACLTVYDMVKAVDRAMTIQEVNCSARPGVPGEIGAAPSNRQTAFSQRRLAHETTDRQVQLRSSRGHPPRLLVRGGLVLAMVGLVASLAGWTRRVSAVDTVRLPDMGLVVSRLGSLGRQLDAARGEVTLPSCSSIAPTRS